MLIDKRGRLLLTCSELINLYGVSENTVKHGLMYSRNNATTSWEHVKGDDETYVYHDSLPEPTKKKTPSEDILRSLAHGSEINQHVERYFKKLQTAYQKQFMSFQQTYRTEYQLDMATALDRAKMAALYSELMSLVEQQRAGTKHGGATKGSMEHIRSAYNKVVPKAKQIGTKQAFNNLLTKIKKNGILIQALDRRTIKVTPEQYSDPFYKAFVWEFTSSAKGFKLPYIAEKLKTACEEKGIKSPSLSWVRDRMREALRNINVVEGRKGKQAANAMMTYANLEQAQYCGDQFQMDAYTWPGYFYLDGKAYTKLVVVCVIDVHSRMIVGFSIALSENRDSMMEAMQNAVSFTNILPKELVTDKHSYHRTKEVEHFMETTQALGMDLTVSMNPQYKAVNERLFQMLEPLIKAQNGTIGQSVKTRDRSGRSSPEYIDATVKPIHRLTMDAVKLSIVTVIQEYNNTPLNVTGNISPAQAFERGEKPHSIAVNQDDRLRLFNKKTSKTVSRFKLILERSGIDYVYDLPAAYQYLNKQEVTIRYESLDLIYLFDVKKDLFITSLKPVIKQKAAKANQTERDQKLSYQQANHKKAIKAAHDKQMKAIIDPDSHPDLLHDMNAASRPKSLMAALSDNHTKALVRQQGVDIDKIIEPIPVPQNTLSEKIIKEKERSIKKLYAGKEALTAEADYSL